MNVSQRTASRLPQLRIGFGSRSQRSGLERLERLGRVLDLLLRQEESADHGHK